MDLVHIMLNSMKDKAMMQTDKCSDILIEIAEKFHREIPSNILENMNLSL